MTKISDLTTLTGAGVDTAADVLPIIDDTETGAARNKKITADELAKSIAPRFRITMDGAVTVETD